MARALVKSIAVPAYNEATTAWTLGTAGVAATQTFNGGTFKYNDGGNKAVRINMDTVDATDDYRILISSGGAAGPNRGAYLEMHGNEFSSTPGRILFESGSTASGSAIAWQVNVGASSVLGHSINGNGANIFGPLAINDSHIIRASPASNAPILIIQGNGTAGAYLNILETASQNWYMGIDDSGTVLNFRPNGTTATAVGTVTVAGAWANTGGGSWGTISDARLKTNIQDLTSGLSVLLQLRPVTYEWREDNPSALSPTTHFIAQEVEQINPKWVVSSEAKIITVDGVDEVISDVKQVQLDASFNAYLVKAIQELSAKNDALDAPLPRWKVCKMIIERIASTAHKIQL